MKETPSGKHNYNFLSTTFHSGIWYRLFSSIFGFLLTKFYPYVYQMLNLAILFK